MGKTVREIDFSAQFGAGLLAVKRDDKSLRWSQVREGRSALRASAEASARQSRRSHRLTLP